MAHKSLSIIGLVVFSLMRSVSAAEEVKNTGPVTLSETFQYLLYSAENDQTYQIDVAMPPALPTATPESMPVIYVVDGNGLFPLLYASTRALQRASELQPVIIVGIGYDTDDSYEIGALRTRDLTPTRDQAFEDQMNGSNLPLPIDVQTGQAQRFLHFIETELKPFINSNFPTNPQQEIFAGYSFGGLFGLYVLFNQTDAFDKYVLGSPSVWWSQGITLNYEEAFAQVNSDLAKTVFLSSGKADLPMMITGAQTLYQRLSARGYENLDIEYLEFEGETHNSGIGVALNRGIKSVLGD